MAWKLLAARAEGCSADPLLAGHPSGDVGERWCVWWRVDSIDRALLFDTPGIVANSSSLQRRDRSLPMFTRFEVSRD